MYRMSGDSSNVMSHPIRHAYGPQQLTLDSSIAVEDQCMKDDLYFNLMYKSFDSNAHGITHRINQLANTENANLRPISTELERNDKAWRSSLLDYRQMDSELERIQRDYEAIENNLARFRKADKRCSPEFKLIGTALLTDHSMAREHFDRSEYFPSTSTLPTDLSAWSSHSGTLTEIPSIYQLPSITDLLAARSNHTAVAATVAATPPPPPPPPPSKPERCQRESVKVEQPVQSQKESNEVRGSEPYYKCPVCWNCVRQRKPVSTTCGHVFCGSCIKAALRTTCKCPVCQRLMTTRQIFRIYL
ncbi:uncharacterized protein LOC133843744 isoform X1 [Drosophila sulfurigaster albostrigata]|uniref:uncharacterized protein LOC133843744 isoform X1 n=2 Tax=Drosophila sulfurigaster albostrigata TaxID=89887 RepID=UPI002D21D753|nr:uncharacterized protein LOC133843744 isoform X1 [Drosophila sulfurigaster albostrigata]